MIERNGFPMMAFAVALLALAVVGGCAAPASKTEVALDYERYQLPNGLDFVLHVDRSDPLAAVAKTQMGRLKALGLGSTARLDRDGNLIR